MTLNLFLLTWVGVGLLQKRPHAPWLSLESIEERYAARLSDNDAAVFRRALEAHKAELAARIDASRETRAAVRQTMQAEPFDPTRLETAFADSRRAMSDFQQALQSLLLDTAGKLSADGRKRLSEHAPHADSGNARPIPTRAAPNDASVR
ncbi:hypothetical protein MoryE10_14120 [Methylogaea oryzae]|uniref:Signaling pathway modulator ZraP n=1 Tax=Methylogaea oryzae TaxID=1295382 RepID=A0A8D4VNE5_9GAMM|nr:hypothetical protein MoryE10_14120 [Methylogaea oryzae]